MIGEADAKYWGQHRPFHRLSLLLVLAFFSSLLVFASIFK
jgi:hypothetical protein